MKEFNYPHPIKAVFFDIDETLIIKDKNYLPETLLPALQKLKAKGIIPAIATGRSLCSFPDKINQLVKEVGIELFVTMNGQYVSHQGYSLDSHPIPKHKIEQVINFLNQHQISYALVGINQIAVSEITPMQQTALNPITLNYIVQPDFYLHNEVFQILPFYDESKDELIANSGILDGLKTVRWHKYSVDLFDSEGSKARGIACAMKALGFTMENAMAFGDGLNDLEMISEVGVGVAMGNAVPELKQVADYITDPIDQDGIANFLAKAGLV